MSTLPIDDPNIRAMVGGYDPGGLGALLDGFPSLFRRRRRGAVVGEDSGPEVQRGGPDESLALRPAQMRETVPLVDDEGRMGGISAERVTEFPFSLSPEDMIAPSTLEGIRQLRDARHQPGGYQGSLPPDLGMTRKQPGKLQRVLGGLGGGLASVADAVGTPNIAGGGPVDIARSFAAAQKGNRERDIASYNMRRQLEADAEERANNAQLRQYRGAQAQKELAQAELDRHKAQVDLDERKNFLRIGPNTVKDLRTGEIMNADAKPLVLSEGQIAFDGTMQPVASVPRRDITTDKLTAEYQFRRSKAEELGLKPGSDDFRRFMLSGALPAQERPFRDKIVDSQGRNILVKETPEGVQRIDLGVRSRVPQTAAELAGMYPGAIPAAGSGLHGEDFLKSIPPDKAQMVKALAEGRMQFPSGFALRSPQWTQMLQWVGEYDPSFDAANYGSRASTRKAFTSGKEGAQVNALNTVVGHLNAISEAADALGNTSIPMLNQAKNWVGAQTGNPNIAKFKAIRNSVADELVRVWRQAGGSEKDIEARLKDLDSANSPEQLHGVIATLTDLLGSKVESLQTQYRQGMGTIASGLDLLTPESQRTIDRLRAKAEGRAMPAAPASASHYSVTATGPGGHKIGSNDGGRTWFDVQTGKQVQ